MAVLGEMIGRCRSDIMYRNILFLRISSVMTLLLALFTIISGQVSRSGFMYALGAYYAILVAIRYILVSGVGRDERTQWALYRASAVILLVLTAAILMLNIVQIRGGGAIRYPWYLIYGVAFICFANVITAIIAFFTGRRRVTPVILAKKNCNIIVAAVSLLSLQYSLTAEFGDDPDFTRTMSASMGMVIFLMILALSIFMISNSTRNLKSL